MTQNSWEILVKTFDENGETARIEMKQTWAQLFKTNNIVSYCFVQMSKTEICQYFLLKKLLSFFPGVVGWCDGAG